MRYISELNCQDCFTIPCTCEFEGLEKMSLEDSIRYEIKLKSENIKDLQHDIAELLLKLEEIQK